MIEKSSSNEKKRKRGVGQPEKRSQNTGASRHLKNQKRNSKSSEKKGNSLNRHFTHIQEVPKK